MIGGWVGRLVIGGYSLRPASTDVVLACHYPVGYGVYGV